VRIVCISDTHGKHEELGKLPDGDVLVHCGDTTSIYGLVELERYVKWVDAKNYKHRILIAGNHDFIFKNAIRDIPVGVLSNIHYLRDLGVVLDGLTFWGMPWTPPFMDWYFMAKPKEMKRYVDMIPSNTDVLITHGPPYGILDKVGSEYVGGKELLKAVRRVKPKVHIFGHIHEGYGQVEKDGTIFINACSLNKRYEVVNKPIVVDVPVVARGALKWGVRSE